MCGIAGAVSAHNSVQSVLFILKELEYRGYDSAGIAGVACGESLVLRRSVGGLDSLLEHLRVNAFPYEPTVAIAHTRWATHGKVTLANAHPHQSGGISLVHNGIIENHEALRQMLVARGYEFTSETDTEVIVHLIHACVADGSPTLLDAVQCMTKQLKGAYAILVISENEPGHLIAARAGSPLVIGVTDTACFMSSDAAGFAHETRTYVALEEGDIADVQEGNYQIYAPGNIPIERAVRTYRQDTSGGLGEYAHFMLKEICEQGRAISSTLAGNVVDGTLVSDCFGIGENLLASIYGVHITACGTSYYAAKTAEHWFKEMGIACRVEIASEYRYNPVVVRSGTMFLWISQSGETADTLAAVRKAQTLLYTTILGICNSDESSLVRESDFTFLTHAGREQSVASTKAFTTQLVALRLLSIALGRQHGLERAVERQLLTELKQLPVLVQRLLARSEEIRTVARRFELAHDVFFLGRGIYYAVALEGALKMKEVSYIHAEAYPAGELKHGPLALVDQRVQAVCMVANDFVQEKMMSNIEEVLSRGAQVLILHEDGVQIPVSDQVCAINVGAFPRSVAPILMVIPLQLLAYHVAVLKGTDVDKPRNLAKSVTVE